MTLIDAVYENAKQEGRKQDGPLRIITQGVLEGGHVVGRVVSGEIRVGERVSVLPAGVEATVKEITVKGKRVKKADAGLNVAIKIDKNIATELRGAVISGNKNKPKLLSKIKAKIFVTGKIGNNLSVKVNGIEIKCKSLKVLGSIDVTTGERSSKKRIELLGAIEAEVVLEKKIPVEDYETTRELGRFVLYSSREFAGICTVGK
jgi:sulfate adenylyltransferase subunit 1